MSGIVGIINIDGASIDRALLSRMTEFMSYRGPDAQEVWVDGSVGFGHTMLRTTRESLLEHQPCSLDGEVWITADARVDGRAELVQKLGSKGIESLESTTDVELILRAYNAWGSSCVDHLLGDFAFAIWDGRRRQLFCARDHFGVKPFYYALVRGALIFSNTLNCLRLHPDVSDELNEVAIGDYLLFALNEDSGTTAFADIRRVPGGHCLMLGDGDVKLSRYWTLPTDGRIRYNRADDYIQHFKELLRTAVDDRLRTDRVAVSMSGGLDSPAIAATAKELLLERGEPFDLRAFTVVCDRIIPDRERYYSGLVARKLDIPIHYIVADDYQLFDRVDRVELREPEPFNVEPLSKLGPDLMEQIASHSRVSLTGWDGDTLMTESPRLYLRELLKSVQLRRLVADAAWYIRSKRALPPLGIRTWLKQKLGKHPVPSAYPPWVNQPFAARVNLRARWRELNMQRPSAHRTRPRALELLSGSNWWCLFENSDPGVSSVPLEIRHPLMDIRLVDYLLAIPPVPWFVDKHILRVTMRNILPEAVRQRPKAPAAGDPVVELSRAFGSRLGSFEPSRELSRFADLTALREKETGPENVWLGLRPFALNRWLEHSTESPSALSGASSHKSMANKLAL